MRLAALRPPRLRTGEPAGERSATWLELFYDLVFVVAVANLGHRLLAHNTMSDVLAYVGLFVPLWWSWAGYTFYADRYDTDDLGQRLLAVCQIVAIALMAAAISGEESDSPAAFAASFVLARLVLLAMYFRAYRHVPPTRRLVAGYMRGFLLGGAFWLVSIWVPDPTRYALWAMGLAVDFATPYLLRHVQATVPLDLTHLPERFGLFTILVLGESIASVIAGLSASGWETAPTVGAILGVVAATSLWWIYFDNLHGAVVRRRPGVSRTWRPTVWIYSHLPLAISLVAAGIGMEFLVSQEVFVSSRWIVAGGVAGALLAMGVISLATDRGDDVRDLRQAVTRLTFAVAAVVIGAVSAGWSANTILAAFCVIGAAQVAIDLWIVTGDAVELDL